MLGKFWNLPNTLLFLVLVKLTKCKNQGNYWYAGDSKLWQWWSSKFGMVAITCGEIIISVVVPTKDLLNHEKVHIQQGRVLGLFYLPVYLILCLWGLLVPGKHWYFDHPMEKQARKLEEEI